MNWWDRSISPWWAWWSTSYYLQEERAVNQSILKQKKTNWAKEAIKVCKGCYKAGPEKYMYSTHGGTACQCFLCPFCYEALLDKGIDRQRAAEEYQGDRPVFAKSEGEGACRSQGPVREGESKED